MKKILLGVVLTLVLLMSFWMFGYFLSRNKGANEKYEVSVPKEMDIVKKTMATGSIKPRHEILIKPQISGVIDELYVQAGQVVKKGMPSPG